MFCDLFFNSKSVSMKILRQSDPPYPIFFLCFWWNTLYVGPIYYKFCLVSTHIHGLAYLPKMLSRLIWLNKQRAERSFRMTFWPCHGILIPWPGIRPDHRWKACLNHWPPGLLEWVFFILFIYYLFLISRLNMYHVLI